MNKIISLFTAILTLSCVEIYELPVEDEDQGLVIEAGISDKSYNETINYPSEGRYFSVTLRRTSPVSNGYDAYESDAEVYVQDLAGNSWMYTEAQDAPGRYYLYDDSFQAEYNEAYQMVIVLETQDTIRSVWKQLPPASAPIGQVDFVETEKQKYVYATNERVLRTLTGVEVTVDVPKNEANDKHFYKWTFQPMWIYIAPWAENGEMCWVTNNLYLNEIVLLEDQVGGYPQELFFLETIENHRVLHHFSVLITQEKIDQPTYRFWEDLQKQNAVGGLFDEPPYSLQTNYSSSNPDLHVMGYFSVAEESATRWEFDVSQLSYLIQNKLREECQAYIGRPGAILGPPADCYSCLDYGRGEPTVEPPHWWNE